MSVAGLVSLGPIARQHISFGEAMKTVAVAERKREAYDAIFETARRIEYPEIDAFEQRMGYAIDRQRLEEAARVLACPIKVHAPHWQHGRVIYAALRKYISRRSPDPITLLDIGTAKGFSAMCLLWAMQDVPGVSFRITSVDVIAPDSTQFRNSIAEVDGPKTLAQVMRDWIDAEFIDFRQSTGIDWLRTHQDRVHAAFIDGKHEGHVVRQEGKLLASRQEPGDLAIFDDCQITGVSRAVVTLEEFWKFDYLTAGPREYAVGWRR